MQLTMQPDPEDHERPWPKPELLPTSNSVVEKYNARRCHVCGAPHTVFGFGPPMTRAGVLIWACALHRDDVERRLTGHKVLPEAEAFQGSLL
jgi:hypothetical protein